MLSKSFQRNIIILVIISVFPNAKGLSGKAQTCWSSFLLKTKIMEMKKQQKHFYKMFVFFIWILNFIMICKKK